LIPFVDLRAQNASIWEEARPRIERLVLDGELILGAEVEAFERAFAQRCRTRHAIGVASGTAALVLALRILDIGRGDEVITVANSFVATVAAVTLVGAEAVLIDVGPDENIDPDLIAAAVTTRTRAIVPVHLRGLPARIEDVRAVAAEHGLAVVEDCAQAVGAECDGQPLGSFGAIGCFSLHPLKNLGAIGDAGVVVTDDDEMADRLRMMRNHGLRTRDVVERWGDNARLAPVQAAVLNVKLTRLARWTKARTALADRYRAALGDSGLELPATRPGRVYTHFVVRTDRRDPLREHLLKAGIDARVHYPIPIHRQPAASVRCRTSGRLFATEEQADRILSLPLYPELAPADCDRVAATTRDFLAATH
jgi:dTDP-4-amino-4,6-dideoxygalactose transaminase